MRRLVLLFALFAAASPLRAADFDPKPIDEIVERGLKEFEVPGAAVVIVLDDQVVYLKGFGVKKLGAEEKVTPDTVFAIASCSKAFTATLVAMLADEGKLAWDDKVHDRLRFFRLSDELADREVTLRDLLCHRTGMPRHDMLWSGLTADPEDVIRRWGRAKSSTSFRSTWEYSNVPFTTAGLIAGRIEQSDWATATRNRLFAPLGMKNSSGTAKEAAANPDHATPHYLGLDKTIAPIGWDEIDHIGGAGCVNSCVRDLGQWLRFQLNGGALGDRRLLRAAALKETHTQQMPFKASGVWAIYFPPDTTKFPGYGLGWFVHDHRGLVCVSHGGTLSGFRAQCMMIPEKKLGVFVVCNLRPSLFPEAVAKSVLDRVAGGDADWVKRMRGSQRLLDFEVAANREKHKVARKPDTKPSRELKAYAGNYDESAYGRAEVKHADEQLTLTWGKYAFRLEHYHFDTFTAVMTEPAADVRTFDRVTFEVQFRLGTDGNVESLQFLSQDFRRKK